VVGELKRHLRDTSWRLHVPRALKERTIYLCRTVDQLQQTLGRSPTIAELARRLQVTEEEVLEALPVAQSRQELSLDRPVGDDTEVSVGDRLAAPAAREEAQDLLLLPVLVAALPDLERQVVVLRFFEDLDQDAIAARIGYSQAATTAQWVGSAARTLRLLGVSVSGLGCSDARLTGCRVGPD
jgi:RNA polymerase sigma-B factor